MKLRRWHIYPLFTMHAVAFVFPAPGCPTSNNLKGDWNMKGWWHNLRLADARVTAYTCPSVSAGAGVCRFMMNSKLFFETRSGSSFKVSSNFGFSASTQRSWLVSCSTSSFSVLVGLFAAVSLWVRRNMVFCFTMSCRGRCGASFCPKSNCAYYNIVQINNKKI